ncbi:DUF177 domain-containing protein [Xanthobacter sp. DSM 24535]|uniref:YceD family protein n=1 Tax=Roseixanthobacter psychrophilus TaxID=3119917 RepID=UPI0037289CA4
MSDLPLTHRISLAEVPAHGLQVQLAPDAAQRAALARFLDVPAVHGFTADLKVMLEGAGAHVSGRLKAQVRQVSVVSLEAFDSEVEEEIDVHFAPEEVLAVRTLDEDDPEAELDQPDAIVDGGIDLGHLATEFLSLALDPYPRLPGEVFEAIAEAPETLSPFAELARLKDKP